MGTLGWERKNQLRHRQEGMRYFRRSHCYEGSWNTPPLTIRIEAWPGIVRRVANDGCLGGRHFGKGRRSEAYKQESYQGGAQSSNAVGRTAKVIPEIPDKRHHSPLHLDGYTALLVSPSQIFWVRPA